MDELKIEVAEALVLKPGDRVLLLVGANWPMEYVDRAQSVLKERFPDVAFAFASGVDQAVIEPAE